MRMLFNNCNFRDHAVKFGKGAFFDLDIVRHANLAVGLETGAMCAVATNDADGLIRFTRYRFEREEVMKDTQEGKEILVRVFFGERIEKRVMSKAAAAKSVEYGALFDQNGNFKRVSGIETGAA